MKYIQGSPALDDDLYSLPSRIGLIDFEAHSAVGSIKRYYSLVMYC